MSEPRSSTQPEPNPRNPAPPTDRDFIDAPGDMAARIRAFDWAATPLGPLEAWPQSLKTVVRLMLATRHPMFIFWGPEHICLYNDAYRASLGPEKHPAILGMPGAAAWPEIWDIIGPQIAMVMRGEGATWHENQLVPILRHGSIQDVYWTYSYGPIDEPSAPRGVGGVLVVCTETTEEVLARQRGVAEVVRLRSLFEAAPGFTCVLRGPNHVFEFVNAAYARLIGGRAPEGRNVRDVLPEAAAQGFIALLDGVYESGEPYVGRSQRVVLQRDADAVPEEFFLDFVYQPIFDVDGAVTGIFVSGSDVTGRVRAEHERQRLIDMLAHDLRTPVTALKALAQMLRREIDQRGVPDAAALRERAARFVELADRMDALVGDLRARPAAALGDEASADRSRVDLAALLADAVAELRDSNPAHRFAVHAPAAVEGDWDGDALRRVAGNLLENAVKYSPEGGPIEARAEVDGGEAILIVRDEGIGIPADDLPHVFEHRRRGSNVGGIAGTGVGLAGVRHVIEQHGGAVSIASEPGRGTTVTVRLPVA